jgi:hypothetical protein
MARNIWSKSPPASVQAQWVRQLDSHTAHSDWAAALRTARQLAPFAKETPWTWHIAQAELYLFDLQPERAVREIEAVFRAIPAARQPRFGSIERQHAAYVMARAKAEQGKYAEAIHWLKQAPREFHDFCGVWAQCELQWAEEVIEVWSKVRFADEQAIPALETVVSRGAAAPKVAKHPWLQYKCEAARHSGVEAALILGEIYLRHGQKQQARFFLNKASAGDDGVAAIARAYLKQLASIRST